MKRLAVNNVKKYRGFKKLKMNNDFWFKMLIK